MTAHTYKHTHESHCVVGDCIRGCRIICHKALEAVEAAEITAMNAASSVAHPDPALPLPPLDDTASAPYQRAQMEQVLVVPHTTYLSSGHPITVPPLPVQGKTATMGVSGAALKLVINRALNTWAPENYPQWSIDLCDALQDGDMVTITIKRAGV